MTHQSQYSFKLKNPDVATDPKRRDSCNTDKGRLSHIKHTLNVTN